MMRSDNPWTRYGLALCQRHARKDEFDASEELIATAQAVLKEAQDQFRLQCQASRDIGPADKEGKTPLESTYDYVSRSQIKDNPKLGGGSGASKTGNYLSPSASIEDGSNGEVWAYLEEARAVKPDKPTSAWCKKFEGAKEKVNPFSKQTNLGGSGIEASEEGVLNNLLALCTTVTPHKPFRWVYVDEKSSSNSCLIPDLDEEMTRLFIGAFDLLASSHVPAPLLSNEVRGKTGKVEHRRPRICQGNFPQGGFGFGGLGVLVGLGDLLRTNRAPFGDLKRLFDHLENHEVRFYRHVAKTGITTHTISHHATELAREGKLKPCIEALIYRTQLYLSSDEKRELFLLHASRFLELFTWNAFRDFLRHRAEYHRDIIPAFNLSFELRLKTMTDLLQDKNYIELARGYGNWVNRTAYFYAATENKGKGAAKIQEAKSKVLNELESAIQSAPTHARLFHNLNTRVGRLSSGGDVAASHAEFMALSMEHVGLSDLKSIITAFMRVSSFVPKENATPAEAVTPETPEIEEPVI
jgi:hypothetical protein